MKHNSTLSICVGIILLLLLSETKQKCHQEQYIQRSRPQTLTVCVNPDYYNYTGYVKESVLIERVSFIQDSLR